MLLGSLTLLLSRASGFLVSLLTVPLTVGYLGTERYGLWLTLSSLLTMGCFADLGVSNGLRTMVSQADGKDDHALISRLITSAAVVLTMTALVLGAGSVVIVRYVDFSPLLLKFTPSLRQEVPGCAAALGATFLLSIPLQIAQSVQDGLQKGYQATLWLTAGSLVSLAALLVSTAVRAPLVVLIVALSGVPALVAFANTVWFFWRQRPDLRPRWAHWDWATGRELLRTGGLFMVLQVVAALSFTSDNFVVGAALGVASVPLLGVPAKLFAMLQQVVGMLNAPLWPAFGEAASRGDIQWVRKTLRRSLLIGLSLTTLGSVILVLFGNWIVEHWSRHQVSAPIALLLPLGVWTVLSAWASTVGMFLNGTGQIAVQTLAAIALAPTAFALKWLLVTTLGPAGVVWATILAFSLCTLGPVWWAQRRVLQNLETQHSPRTA